MSTKILGLDLGTSSIGTALRNPNLGDDLKSQLEYFSSDIFASGVGHNKNGEYSFAAERTKHRSSRRLNERRRRRLWETLKYLITEGYCPLSEEDLHRWCTYDKSKGLRREYPIESVEFDQWIKLDFNGDGLPDYTNPYELRAELMTRQFDFSQPIERFKLGRALYHIAQRRGFKSSKGETLAEQEKKAEEKFAVDDLDLAAELKKSEEKKSKDLESFRQAEGLTTVGQAYAALLSQGTRIRGSIYQAVRSQYKDEIYAIFKFQDGLSLESSLYKHIMSEKKGEGSIFYKEPLRSQKGNVGKCTLEPNKARCPQSHPVYEEFRAWSFLNNIKYRENGSIETPWINLSLEIKEELYKELFLGRVKSDFQFKEIREKLEKRLGVRLYYPTDGGVRTINYKDNVCVGGCPITARLRKMLGENWSAFSQKGSKIRPTHSKNKSTHQVCYTAEDIWSVCFDAEEIEDVLDFVQNRLGWNKEEERSKDVIQLWKAIRPAYAMLSRKAMTNINEMLRMGLIYSDAVLIAKLPDLIGREQWCTIKNKFIQDYSNRIKPNVDRSKIIVNIVNRLIADYKSLGYETGQFAYKDFEYRLQESDHQDILNKTINVLGKKSWELMDAEEQEYYLVEVTKRYQAFFCDQKRDYCHSPRLCDSLNDYLKEMLSCTLTEQKLDKLYHPSMISVYKPKDGNLERSMWRLDSPNIGSIKNPVAMRTLNILRRKINAMLDAGMIDPEETRIVVETARDLKDANERWAIETWQKERAKQNKAIEEILEQEFPQRTPISKADIDKARDLLDQAIDYACDEEYLKGKRFSKEKDIKKYKLWLEQGCRCMYTGRMIPLSNLFDESTVDFEHTIPRSISFDSSDMNLTVCYAYYNRSIKKKRIPTQLENYDKAAVIDGTEYPAIADRLRTWQEKVEQLRSNVAFWKAQSSKAQDKTRKDQCIRQRHLWQLELDYWQGKLSRFTMTEVKEGFRNSQLVDTGIITRHAVAYLKSVFAHVDVQKGSVTADFRKMLGVQSIDEKKDRSLHSHHAIDATMLTVIPAAALRDKMLTHFYQKEENPNDTIALGSLKREIAECHIGGNIGQIPFFINENILVNHHANDRTLNPARRRCLVRGKAILDKSMDGELHERWTGGDSIRIDLHETTYPGAIKMLKDGKLETWMVVRIPVDKDNFKSDKDIEKIVDPNVRDWFIKAIKKGKEAGLSFAETISEGIWPLDSNGIEVKQDKNGRPLKSLRHVRCRVAAGKGFLTYDTARPIRNQLNSSQKALVQIDSRDHKQKTYAKNGGNYLFLLYEGIKKGKVDRKSRIISGLDIALYNKEKKYQDKTILTDANQLCKEPYYASMTEKGILYGLTAIIKVGYRVLLWNECPDELRDMTPAQLSERLYVVQKFNHTSADHVYLKHHLDAGKEEIYVSPVPNDMNCMIEHRDFKIDALGNILFFD